MYQVRNLLGNISRGVPAPDPQPRLTTLPQRLPVHTSPGDRPQIPACLVCAGLGRGRPPLPGSPVDGSELAAAATGSPTIPCLLRPPSPNPPRLSSIFLTAERQRGAEALDSYFYLIAEPHLRNADLGGTGCLEKHAVSQDPAPTALSGQMLPSCQTFAVSEL